MSSNDSNWWNSSVEDDFTPVSSRSRENPYHTGRGGGRNSGRNTFSGRGVRGEYNPPYTGNLTKKQDPTPFCEETRKIVADIVNAPSNTILSEIDFDEIACPREHFQAVLYVAAQRGNRKYRGSKADLAERLQFESVRKLLELINDPDKMEKKVYELNATIAGPPSLTEYSRLIDFSGVLGDEIMCGIGSTNNKAEKKIHQLNGIKRILVRNYGTTEEAQEFFRTIQMENEKTINEYYSKPGRFASSVKYAKQQLEWNPAQIPAEELKKKPSKFSPAEQQDGNQATDGNCEMKSVNTPSKQIHHDSAKACHKPNSVLNLDLMKLALMSNDVAVDYLIKILNPYLDKYYGKSEEILELLKKKKREDITRLIINEGELERLASTNMIYPTTKAQTPSDKDKLRLTKTDYSFVLQYSRQNANGISAIDCTMEIYRILHPIANSFQCSIGLETMHDASNESTIYELDMMNGIIDDAFVSNITKEKYKDTLQFRFRLITQVDIVNLLGRVKEILIDGKKTLGVWLKEKNIYLNVLWKSPESFMDVKRIVGATIFTNPVQVVKELQDWLQTHQEFECEANQLKVKWRKRRGKNLFILSTDPSIAEKVANIIKEKWKALEPTEFQEIYDYEFYSFSADKDEESFEEGCMRQREYHDELVHLRLEGISHDLYTIQPNLSKNNWVDDGTICQLLLSQDEPLFHVDRVSQYSPFRKLYRDGRGWILLWTKDKHNTAKLYLNRDFRKDLSKWTGANYESLDYEVCDPSEDIQSDTDTDTASVTESQSQNRENVAEPKTGESGRVPRPVTVNQLDTKPATITTDRGSQTTNPVSSLTQNSYPRDQYGISVGYGGASSGVAYNGATHNPAYPYAGYPQAQAHTTANYTSQPYSFQFHDNGQVVNMQQLNHLFQAVEKSTYSVVSNQFTQVLAFHNPVNGIKNMITDEFNKLHDTIKSERATQNLEHFNSTTPKPTAIPRCQSFNDIQQRMSRDISRFIAPIDKEEVDSILETKSGPQANRAQQNSQSNVATIPGSYSENFVPHPERVPQPSQDSNDGSATPINQVINQPPGSYHGEIRNIGDNLMRNLDDQLKTMDESVKPNVTNNETEQATDIRSIVANKDDVGDVSSAAGKPGDDANQAQDASEPSPISGRTRKQHLQTDQLQTQNITTTGDPNSSKPSSKATRTKR